MSNQNPSPITPAAIGALSLAGIVSIVVAVLLGLGELTWDQALQGFGFAAEQLPDGGE